MNSGEQAYLGCQRTDIVKASAVNTLALVEPVAHDLLLQLVDALVDHECLFGIFLIELGVDVVLDGVEHFLTLVLVVGIKSYLYTICRKCLDGIEHIVIHFLGLKFKLLLAYLSLDVADKGNYLLYLLMPLDDGIEHSVVVNFVCACLDHDYLFHCACNGEVKVIPFTLCKGGVEDYLTVHKAYADAGNGAVPGNIGYGYGNGGGYHTQYLGLCVGIYGEDGHNNGHVISHILGEKGSDRAVNHTGGEYRLITGLALTLGERAGDAAYGVHLLLIVNRQREEVYALPGLYACGNVCHNGGVAVSYPAGAVGELAGLACFNSELTPCKHSLEYSVIVKSLSCVHINLHLFLLKKGALHSFRRDSNRSDAQSLCAPDLLLLAAP